MTSATAIALIGFIAWALFLLVLMELLRGRLVVLKRIPANEFRPDNSNLSPFMQRLARAHANCVEGLPIFGGLLLVALVTGQSALTDPLAYPLLAARLLQSAVHLASQSILAVNLRFAFFAIQLAIAAYWAIRLLSGPVA
ncbi:MAPEG family protein [Pseudomonas cavernae]|uniref:MAPEG family protein n=1 Tax=Pseudomonas cavernae TaxID=2320867 RepID=A0A385Z4S2_9PSED|nr:MAPEG family protein [Pseudomonas cavernae]AYC34136.1 MAPEG family protein [Pseudomonas cavernae]